MKSKEKKTNNFIVTKSNNLIEAHYNLSAIEQKIILYFVSKIQKDDDEFKKITIPVIEFCKLLGYSENSRPNYKYLATITKKLLSKVVEINVDGKLRQFQWVSFVEYNTGEGTITLEFHREMKPFLLKLKKEFTSYRLKNIMTLNSLYSIRLYEILKKWQPIGKIDIKLSDLRKMVGATDKYLEYSNFKKKVLNIAKKELQKNTDLTFEFEELKEGKKVIGIRFLIKNGSSFLPQLPEENSHDQAFYKEIKTILKNYGLLDFDEHIIERWLALGDKYWKEKKYEYIMSITKNCLETPGIENPIGYITYMVKNGHINIQNNKKAIRNEKVPDWLDEHKSLEAEKLSHAQKELTSKEAEALKKDLEKRLEKYKKIK